MLTQSTYQNLVASLRGKNVLDELPRKLVPLWGDDYYHANPKAELVEINLKDLGASYHHLFDISLGRAVVAYGQPIVAKHDRDSYRIQAQPQAGGKGYDHGHLIAHTLGGGTDLNLAPQLARVNRTAFQVLERRVREFASLNIQSFYFVRLVYRDKSQLPFRFEQCAIDLSTRQVHYTLHPNS